MPTFKFEEWTKHFALEITDIIKCYAAGCKTNTGINRMEHGTRRAEKGETVLRLIQN